MIKLVEKSPPLRAVKWTGSNKDEIAEFLWVMAENRSVDPEAEYRGHEPGQTLHWQIGRESDEVQAGNWLVFILGTQKDRGTGELKSWWFYYGEYTEGRLWDSFELETP